MLGFSSARPKRNSISEERKKFKFSEPGVPRLEVTVSTTWIEVKGLAEYQKEKLKDPAFKELNLFC